MHLVMTASLLLVAVSCAQESPHEAKGVPISTQEMIEYLQRLESAQEDAALDFEVTWYFGEGSGSPPEKLAPEHFVQRQHVRSILSKERYRMVNRILETNPNIAALKGQEQTFTWDGQEARAAIVGSDSKHPERQSVRIDGLPTQDIDVLGVWTWSGWWVFSGSYFQGYADLLRGSGDTVTVREQGGATQWVFASPAWAYTEVVMTGKRVNGAVTLASVEQHNYHHQAAFDAHDTTKIFCTKRIEFGGELASNINLVS